MGTVVRPGVRLSPIGSPMLGPLAVGGYVLTIGMGRYSWPRTLTLG